MGDHNFSQLLQPWGISIESNEAINKSLEPEIPFLANAVALHFLKASNGRRLMVNLIDNALMQHTLAFLAEKKEISTCNRLIVLIAMLTSVNNVGVLGRQQFNSLHVFALAADLILRTSSVGLLTAIDGKYGRGENKAFRLILASRVQKILELGIVPPRLSGNPLSKAELSLKVVDTV
ncbi:hypothetical protein [Thiorhodovibrio frisius]|uniref:Uncharacterized protein n=1 Tax=Thiorhodovibrio frisius TaxID=631362 RepID=H8YWC2_9GAMM|nr:hypothetical protein [Thiorhodovibrio frisius]EIC23725.1 hypothetical protein Thi970DRAFT_00228 [Thiorhodovibrio frisius]WPL20123.1 hypothetical protein Thiofri_00179 [Thiorhodovibrio frisius]